VGRGLRSVGIATLSLLAACGGIGTEVDVHDPAAADYGLIPARPASSPEGPIAPRLKPNRRVIVPNLRVHLVYVGDAQPEDVRFGADLVRYLETSEYWGILAQYGVEAIGLASVSSVSADAFFGGQLDPKSSISMQAFEERTRAYVAEKRGGQSLPPPPSSITDAELPPDAEGYVFFLPPSVAITFGKRGSYEVRTCTDFLGYHRFNGAVPYGVIPSCSGVNRAFVLSHELAEMATDPIVGLGWQSPTDNGTSAGEVADICLDQGPKLIDGWALARLWSNATGQCEPTDGD
jgi:hypothetical protein